MDDTFGVVSKKAASYSRSFKFYPMLPLGALWFCILVRPKIPFELLLVKGIQFASSCTVLHLAVQGSSTVC